MTTPEIPLPSSDDLARDAARDYEAWLVGAPPDVLRAWIRRGEFYRRQYEAKQEGCHHEESAN